METLEQDISRVSDARLWDFRIAAWRRHLDQTWGSLHFGEVKVETKDRQHLFEAQVYLNDLDPDAVRVELYADGVNGGNPLRQEMKRVGEAAGTSGVTVYRAVVSAVRVIHTNEEQMIALSVWHILTRANASQTDSGQETGRSIPGPVGFDPIVPGWPVPVV